MVMVVAMRVPMGTMRIVYMVTARMVMAVGMCPDVGVVASHR
jgi:hypothetical protein